ncbi:helix-turn-helix domain-containing protein [Streptomyces sp. NPDC050400]|uniref:helix-turn-helix domain-containing protein n=1 Tax=Streptomyces sp. NPDC050400 TaxID=3365610 RepID=UPI0037B89111
MHVRHATRYTVIGNHLLQHRELSLTAIGLAGHIQSLPPGASITIKSLAARFPEGEVRIARALRELESHGYLSRTRQRLPSGQMVTHTTSYNNPGARPTRTAAAAAAGPTQTPPQRSNQATPLPPPELDATDPAVSILASLRRDDPRLTLPARDVARLAPAVTAWLDRNITPEAVRRTLTSALPTSPIHHPAALLSHRLTNLLPPPLPPRPHLLPTASTAPLPAPLQNCDGCDRAFRATEPGLCRACGAGAQGAA